LAADWGSGVVVFLSSFPLQCALIKFILFFKMQLCSSGTIGTDTSISLIV